MWPLAAVFPCFPRHETLAAATGCPASVTVNVTFFAFLWLKLAGFALSDSPGRIWVWNRSFGNPVVESWSLRIRSALPELAWAWRAKTPDVCAGGLMLRTGPNDVPVVFVRTAWIAFFASLYQDTHSRPWGAAASATRAPVVLREPGTTLAVEEPTFQRSMWAHCCLEVEVQEAMQTQPPA